MTRIRRINVSQVDGNGSNNNDTNEIRPYGEIGLFVGNNNKLELLMFDGVRTHVNSKVLSKGTFYGGDADSSDGLNYDSIKLVPDEFLRQEGSDQYVIIEPTGGEPGHVHIRAGGTIDFSTADLFLGGEQQNVRVSDTNDRVTITTDLQNTWTFNGSGNLILPGSSNGMIGESEPGLVVFSDLGFAVVTNAATTSSQSWIFDTLGKLRLPGGSLIEDTNTVLAAGTIITVSLNAAGDTEDYVGGASVLEIPKNAETDQVQAGWIITFSNNQQRTVTGVVDGGSYWSVQYADANPGLGASTYPLTIQSANYNSGSNGDLTISLTNINNSTTSLLLSADGSLVLPSNLSISPIGNFAPVIGTFITQAPGEYLGIVSTGDGGGGQIGWAENAFVPSRTASLGFNVGNAGSVDIITGDFTGTTYTWIFGANGILELPGGGEITSDQITNEVFGTTTTSLALVPGGATDPNQRLEIYSTIGGEGNHLHLTSGGSPTELYLGNDSQYVKLGSSGEIEVSSQNGLTLWGEGVMSSSYLLLPNNVDSSSTNVTLGNVNGDVLIQASQPGNPVPQNWFFGKNGSLTFPDGTAQTTAHQGNTGSWTISSGANSVSFTVPANAAYTMWVNGNIPNGIVVWNATVSLSNTNVPAVGTQYGWYYAVGNALVLDSIPDQIVGTAGTISSATVVTTSSNVFTFGITNNSGSSQVVNWGYTKI